MTYREIWEIEVRHEGLNKYRHIRGSERSIVNRKAIAQQLAWDEMWEKKQAAEEKRREREAQIKGKEKKKQLAITKTKQAEADVNRLKTILLHTLNVDDAIDWASLLDKEKYPVNKPSKKPFRKEMPSEPKSALIPDEPQMGCEEFTPAFGFLDKFSAKSRQRKEDEAQARFSRALADWQRRRLEILENDARLMAQYQIELADWEAARENHAKKQSELLKSWQSKKRKYEESLKKKNAKILEKKSQYKNKEPGAITDYCDMVLANSEYPDYFPQDWDLDYSNESATLIVDYSLPGIDDLPTLKDVRYNASRDELKESHLSAAALNTLYDGVLYQIAIRTIHELYEADSVNAISSVVFNGWVRSVDKGTGHSVNACIMSVQASKDEFLAISLKNVDPKATFKQLKGVGSSKLHGLAPVAPILTIDKQDRRFVTAYDVVDAIDESDNLAVMDWQDFENLIREVFEKEFAASGGEVKITQASRDGGVDAIAFDPDPLRGGKIVIQAKRYTNTVGVSAVRDLYGTTLSEGATKGILVTTSDYGPDAYRFAKGKPLTLLSGNNLLHLLEKHGHRARIDLKEARMILAEEKSRD